MLLNQRADQLCRQLVLDADRLRVTVDQSQGRPRLIDFGIDVRGGLEAGRRLAEICLAGLGDVALVASEPTVWTGPAVQVRCDHPVAACMASQYAGWEVNSDDYFAMGSGPMRAAAGREPLFETIGLREQSEVAVGVLEADRLPPLPVCRELADKCGVAVDQLTLLVAPTASQAGTVQIVARSIETALHKLHELGFDLKQVESGFGIAPLPPVAADFLSAVGRTNDAIIYGGQVTLYVRSDDDELARFGAQVPSQSSSDHGLPFSEIFEKYDKDFYRIDPQLFSPAEVTLVNLATGSTQRFGETVPRVLRSSFGVPEAS